MALTAPPVATIGARSRVTLLCGGLGGARLAPWLAERVDLTVVCGVADDLDWHGLRVCPDIDAVLYALAGIFDHERGYAIAGDTFEARDLLAASGVEVWFNIGDRDLRTHLARTALLHDGLGLAEATRRLAVALNIDATVLPASEDPIRTMIRSGSIESTFQEFFVRDRASRRVDGVRWAGLERAHPAPGVLDAINDADLVIIGESSPVASILPILGASGVRDTLSLARGHRLALSPMVTSVEPIQPVDVHHGRARGLFMAAHGMAHHPQAVIDAYTGLIDTFIFDDRDGRIGLRADMRLEAADLLDRRPPARRRLVDRLVALATARSGAAVARHSAVAVR